MWRWKGEETYDRQFLKRPRALNPLERLPQLSDFLIHQPFCLLCRLQPLRFKRLDCANLSLDVVLFRRKRLELPLHLVDDGRVLQQCPVGRKVDGGRLFGEGLDAAFGVVVALFERREGLECAAF